MILITGGAGFIGSNLQASLASRGLETVVVDWLGTHGKWRNLALHPPSRIVLPEDLDDFLADHPPIEIIYHLGAISATTAVDGDETWQTNVELSLKLWNWCAARGAKFVYASSGATYGNGAEGFEDDPDRLDRLRPLNLYGWTKHAFDLAVARKVARGERRPPQWAGLKFFNVYGPNEYHKASMISVVKVKYDEVAKGGPARLFRSNVPGLPDGDQRRDFIHVDDVVDVMRWLRESGASGIFNVGTGNSRTYRDLAYAVCEAVGQPPAIEYIDMPASLHGQYQSYTEASIDRLRAAGYAGQFAPLEEGVRRYVQDFLMKSDPYR